MALTQPLLEVEVPHDGGYLPSPPGHEFKGEDNGWALQCRQWYEIASAAKRYNIQDWNLNALFLRGGRGQFHYRLHNSQQIAYDDSDEDGRLAINRLMAAKTQLFGKIARSRPMPQAAAVTMSPQDVLSQKVANNLFRNALISKWRWALRWAELCDGMVDFGGAFFKIGWDPTVIDYVQTGTDYARVNGPQGPQLIPIPRIERRQVGDVEITVGSPHELFPDPRGKDIDFSDRVFVQHARPVTLEEVEDMYPNADMDKVSGTQQSWLGDFDQWMRIQNGDDRVDMSSSGRKWQGTTLLVETWVKPRPSYPSGAFVHMCGDYVLGEPQPWPVKKLLDYPFYYARFASQPGMFWGRTPISDLRVPQALDNMVTTKGSRNIEDFGDQYLLLGDRNQTDTTQFDGRHKAIYVDSDQPEPRFISPNPMFQHYAPFHQRNELLFNEISQVHEVSRGDVPAGVKSGRAIGFLQEADDMSILSCSFTTEAQVGRAGQMMIALCAQYYTDGRIVQERIATAKQAGAFSAYRTGDLEGATMVRVEAGSMLALTRDARLQLLRWMQESGLLAPGPGTAQLLLSLAGVGDVSGVLDEALEGENEEFLKMIEQQAVQSAAAQQPPADVPSLSIPWDGLDVSGKVQVAAKAGIQIDPAAIAQMDAQRMRADLMKQRGALAPGG